MAKDLSLRVGVAAVLCFVLGAGSFINSAIAANTHSLDLESSSSQYLSVTDGSQTGLDITSALTFEAWVKFESTPSSGNQMTIISKREGGTNNRQYDFSLFNSGGTLKLNLMLTSHGNNVDATWGANWTPTAGVWYQVATTWNNSSHVITFYVNGTSIGTVDTSLDSITTLYDGTAAFVIGASEAGGNSYFDGLIDDVRVWNRELSPSEIADLYDDSEGFSNGTGLVGWWKFDNDYADSSENGNTLTPSNGPVFSTDVPVVVPPPPPPLEADLEAYKSEDESRANSTALQSDNDLVLALEANTTYSIEGVVFVNSSHPKPDITIGFDGESGTESIVGYDTGKESGMLSNTGMSQRIDLRAGVPVPIFIKGTIETGSADGEFELQWAQSAASAAATTVMKGSYLRVQEL